MTQEINTTDEWLWTEWSRKGKPPVDLDVDVITDGEYLTGIIGKAAAFDWRRVLRCAVRNPNYIAPQLIDYPALLKEAGEALEVISILCKTPPHIHAPSIYAEIEEEVRNALASIRKAGVK